MGEMDRLQAELDELRRARAALDGQPLPEDEDDGAFRDAQRMRLEREIREVKEKLQVAEAKEGIELAGVLGGEPKPPAPHGSQLAPDVAKAAPRGCSPTLFVIAAIVVALVIGAIALLTGKDEDEVAANCPTPGVGGEGSVGDLELQLISHAQACPSEDEADDDDVAASDGASKPSEDEIPEGAILVEGTSGGPIGCITCDGQSRFLSLEADTTAVGNANAGTVATTWPDDGQILEFGARLTAPNLGRYGVNLFYTDSFEYGPGVALEVGEQSAVYQWTPERDGTVHGGRPVAIIVGEGGTVDEDGVPLPQGDYTLEWWFVFQPD